MDVDRPRGVDLLNSVPPCLNRPPSRSPLRRHPPASPGQLRRIAFGEDGQKRGALAICDKDETRTESSRPFSLVISFTIFSLARSMRSFSEVLGSQTSLWYTPFLLRPSLDSFFRGLRHDEGLSGPDGPHGALAELVLASRTDRTGWRICTNARQAPVLPIRHLPFAHYFSCLGEVQFKRCNLQRWGRGSFGSLVPRVLVVGFAAQLQEPNGVLCRLVPWHLVTRRQGFGLRFSAVR